MSDPIGKVPSQGVNPNQGGYTQEGLGGHAQSREMGKKGQAIEQQATQRTTKDDQEKKVEDKKDLQRIQEGSLEKMPEDQQTQTAKAKENFQNVINELKAGKPNLKSFNPDIFGVSFLGSFDDSGQFSLHSLTLVTSERLNSFCQKLGIDTTELTKSIQKDLNDLADEFAAKGLSGTVTPGEEGVIDALPGKPGIAPPAGEEAAAAAPAAGTTGGVNKFFSTNLKAVITNYLSQMERENQNSMRAVTKQVKDFMDAGIDQINEISKQTQLAGKAEAKATVLQGTQAMVGGIVSFSSVAVSGLVGGFYGGLDSSKAVEGDGFFKNLWNKSNFFSEGGGMGFKAGTEIGQHMGQAASGGVNFAYSQKIGGQQVKKAEADARAGMARSTEQMMNSTVQMLTKAQDASLNFDDSIRQTEEKISSQQLEANKRLIS